ncbi:MAG: hypothetical protein ABIH49_02585 [archaeon]
MKSKRGLHQGYKRIFVIENIFLFLIVLLSSISAEDVYSWQGQYYTGTTFHQGTYEFNFTVYDAKTGGSICWTNSTNLTTGNFGEWKTEQSDITSYCSNSSADYFLEVKIDNESQGERRLLSLLNYVRKDAPSEIIAPVTFRAPINLSEPIYDLDDEIEFYIGTIHHHTNKSGLTRHVLHNVDDGSTSLVSHSLENDLGYLFSLSLTSSNYFSVPNNISFKNQPSIGHSTFNDLFFIGGKYTGFQWFTNPNNDSSNIISNIMTLNRYGNLSVLGNITSNSGFFSFLGDSANRITKLFVQDVDVSGNLTGITKEVFFPVDPTDTNLGNFRSRSVGSGGVWRFNFQIPSDFSSLTNLEIILIPTGTNAAAPVDLYSDCGVVGEPYNQHSETLSTTWNLGTANNIYALDISGAFTNLSTGDFCGLQVDEGAFGFATNYLGIKLKYET